MPYKQPIVLNYEVHITYIISYQQINLNMAQPVVQQGQNYNIFVGVVIAEIAIMLLLYIILKMIHYIVWGHLDDENQNQQKKNQAEVDKRRWDQNSWDIYFPIMFANHVIASALPLIYNPSIFACVVGWIHFALFIGVLVLNMFIQELEPGKGARTTATRILWLIMCITNLVMIIVGLAGIGNIIV